MEPPPPQAIETSNKDFQAGQDEQDKCCVMHLPGKNKKKKKKKKKKRQCYALYAFTIVTH
ncbi:hypothetical protein CFP56_012240 [Quercus suber]|uniref:Uncharacterized protein n=1 Tax=Quercus suber TaxID=58331 RepID=A0AAW0M363_QUESU